MAKKKTNYKLSPRTIELGEVLLTVPWFESIGQPLDAPHAAKRVETLRNAIKLFRSTHWDSTILEARNGFSETLYAKAPDLPDNWNEIIYATNDLFEDRYKAVYEKLVREKGLPPKNWTQFILTIRHACQESEYIDILPLGFFSEIISWYMDGYFPCGFDGDYPNGQLMVY
jgi:hypothetical protein